MKMILFLPKEVISGFDNAILNFITEGFPGGSDGKEFACNAGYPGLIPGL